MCGIIGMFNTKIDIDMIVEALINQEHRGTDSYGFIGYDGKKLTAYKTLSDSIFIKFLQKIEKKKFKWFIIHHRKTSVGSKNIENAHPVWDKEGKVFVIQNGTKKSLGIKGRNDTYGIMVLYKSGELEKEDLKGSGVVFIIDHRNKKIIFHKDKSRTLYFNKDLNIFSSEPVLKGEWYKVKEQEIQEIDYDKFSKLDIDERVKVEINKVVIPSLCDLCYNKGILINTKWGEICVKCNELSDKEKEEKIRKKFSTYKYYNSYKYHF